VIKQLLSIFYLTIIFLSCEPNQDKISVFIDTTQCLSNEWDVTWLETHEYDEYPSTEDGRLKIFTDYYKSVGVKMYDSYSKWIYNAVCAACICPTGERYYCTVIKSDVEFLLNFGFNLE
jgi:hypothetical protein